VFPSRPVTPKHPDYTPGEVRVLGRALLPGIAAALGFGVACGYLLFPGVWAVLAAGGTLALGASLRSTVALWAAAFALGLALPQKVPLPDHLAFQLPALEEVTGRVLDLPDPRAKTDALTLDPVTLPVRLLAYVPKGLELFPGDLVRLRGEFGVPSPPAWRSHLERRGVYGLFFAREVEVLHRGSRGLLGWAGRVRARLLSVVSSSVPEPGGSVLAALLLGARGSLPEQDDQAFRAAGVAHVLALSGLHVGLLAAGGWWLLGLVRLPGTWRYLLLVPAVGLYVLLGGARVSLVRAGIMFAVLGVFWVLWAQGWVLRRWLDPVQGLALAAVAVILVWPHATLEAGFQLSFAATGAILLLLPHWTASPLRKRLPKGLRWPVDLLAVTACAQVGALPFLGASFGYVTPYGLVANLVLVPWTAALLWGGVVILALTWTPVAEPLGAILDRALVRPYLAAVRGAASLPGATLPVGPYFGLWCLFLALAVLILVAYIENERGDLVRSR